MRSPWSPPGQRDLVMDPQWSMSAATPYRPPASVLHPRRGSVPASGALRRHGPDGGRVLRHVPPLLRGRARGVDPGPGSDVRADRGARHLPAGAGGGRALLEAGALRRPDRDPPPGQPHAREGSIRVQGVPRGVDGGPDPRPYRACLPQQGWPSDARARLAGGGDEGRGEQRPDSSGGIRTMMDRNIGLEAVRLTEAAAMASARLMGRGDEKAADQAAVDAMRKAFNALHIRGTIVIGEGERDEAPMLYIGEKVGRGAADDPEVDIALDPLEGTTITATGGPNALSVIAMADKGNLLNAPDTYMDKIAVGASGAGVIDLRKSPTQNLRAIADRKGVYVEDLTVIILNRPRHEKLIAEVRQSGARIKLIGDGDVSAAIATCFVETGVDVLMGIGGAPEGVIAAAALRCCGGDMQGKLAFRNDKEIERARKMGIADPNKIYTVEEMAKGPVIFAATGVTTGDFLKGVRFFKGGAATQSVVMRSKTHTIRYLETTHFFEHKPSFAL